MTTFFLHRQDCLRRVHKKANADGFNFTSQIAQSICTVLFTNRVKAHATIFESQCSRMAVSYRLKTGQALPLSQTKVLRLANGSPKLVRSPARWPRFVRDTTGKTSGEMSCVSVVQCPHNRQSTANARSPDDQRYDSQDNLRENQQSDRAITVPQFMQQPT